MSGDEDVHRGLRQPGLPHQLEEAPLEPGARELALRPVDREGGCELRRTGMVRVPREHPPHRPEVEKVPLGCPIQHPLDRPRPLRGSEVEVGPRERGDRNPLPHRHFVADQHRAVDEIGPPRPPRLRRRDFDRLRPVPSDIPEPRRRAMAGDDRPMPPRDPSRRRRQYCGHAPSLPRQILMPHRVDAAMHPVDSSGLLGVRYPHPPVSQRRHLPDRHQPVLRRRQLRQPPMCSNPPTLVIHTKTSVGRG